MVRASVAEDGSVSNQSEAKLPGKVCAPVCMC
jgi:hypothetical protein